jgi:hypothetical protein
MYQALKKGPLVVGVKADTPFLEYAGGVFTSATCAGQPNHAVVIVGAGTDLQLGANFWLIRNRWGAESALFLQHAATVLLQAEVAVLPRTTHLSLVHRSRP